MCGGSYIVRRAEGVVGREILRTSKAIPLHGGSDRGSKRGPEPKKPRGLRFTRWQSLALWLTRAAHPRRLITDCSCLGAPRGRIFSAVPSPHSSDPILFPEDGSPGHPLPEKRCPYFVLPVKTDKSLVCLRRILSKITDKVGEEERRMPKD